MEAACALYTLQREGIRRRYGTVGLVASCIARYLRVRTTRSHAG